MSHLGRFIEGIEIGNVLVQTANIALTTGDTSLVSINIQANNLAFSTLSLPNLTTVTDNINIQSSNLTSISLPLLATIANTSNNTVIVGNNFLTSIDLHSLVSAPNLQITGNNATCSIDLHSFTTGDGNQFFCTSIDLTSLSTTNTNSNGFQIRQILQSTLDLPALTTVGDGISITNCPGLTAINWPLLSSINMIANNFFVNTCPLLTSLDFSSITNIPGSGFIISSNATLSSIDFSTLTTIGNNFDIDYNAVTALSFSSLTTAGDNFSISNEASLSSIDFSALTTVGNIVVITNTGLTALSFPSLTTTGFGFDISGNASLTSINFPVLTTIGDSFNIISNAITSMDLTGITSIGGGKMIAVYDNSSLASILISATFTALFLNFSYNALPQSGPGSVDEILAHLDAAGYSGGTIRLGGGTNATPSGAGITSVANLTGKSWVVSTN